MYGYLCGIFNVPFEIPKEITIYTLKDGYFTQSLNLKS